MAQANDWFDDWFTQSLQKIQGANSSSLSNINALSNHQCVNYFDLLVTDSPQLPSIATVKLNGGLGSSMGCHGPKSLIQIAPDGTTFLDKIINSHCNSPLSNALILLNSFNTESQTKAHIRANFPSLDWINVCQQAFKKIDADSLQPLQEVTTDAFNPPGHGSVYFDLYYSGILHQLQASHIDYLFISNADNLAATVDPTIVQYLAVSKPSFLMELTPKTDADKKGGTVVDVNNRLTLWEIAQVTESQQALFESQPYFNTNNIWVSVTALINAIESRQFKLDIIKNKKVRDAQPVIQMEYAMGSAIQSFSDAQVLVVPRTRFFPVKRTSDLLLLLSDCCSWSDSGQLDWDPNQLPLITLSSPLNDVSHFFKYFQRIPSIKHLESLQLSGPILFDSNVNFDHQKLSF